MKSRNRGQVALFVVIGIVLLLAVILFLILKKGPEQDLDRMTAEDVAPVNDFVVQCSEQSLEQLLREAGANGGFIDPSHLRHSALSWKSDLVLFPPQEIAYWSHVKECDNIIGCEATEEPPLCRLGNSCPIQVSLPNDHPSLQEQLEEALPAEIERCLNGFGRLQDLFEVEQTGDTSAEVLFGRDQVFATVKMPLKVTSLATGESLRLEEFPAVADVDILRLYKLSHELAQAERQTAFLERLTLHLLSIYGGVDSEIPPMRGITLLGEKRFWSRTQVEQHLQYDILPFTDFIQLANAQASFRPIWPSNSSGLSPFDQKLFAGIYQYLYILLEGDQYPDVKAHFFYPQTKPYLSINGGKEILKARSADVGGFLSKLSGVFINDYRFKYDIAYPVIVTLTDDNAFNGRGYSWSFALESNIWRNKPLNRSSAVSQVRLIDERVDFSSPLQRVDNQIIIRTTDKWTGDPLPYTRISYQCGEEYFIGETDAEGYLETRLPFCRYGGAITYSKKGYLASGVDYDNFEEGVTRTFDLGLWPLRNVTFVVRKRTPENTEALMTTRPNAVTIQEESVPLNDTDVVIFNINRVKENPLDDDVPLIGFYTFAVENQTLTIDIEAKRTMIEQQYAQGLLTERQYEDWIAALDEETNGTVIDKTPAISVQLAPGKYTVEAFLIHNQKVEIPEETKEFCVIGGGSLCLDKKEMTLNATNFSQWISGGIFIDEENPYELSENLLYRFNTFTFYALEQDVPATWSEMEEYTDPTEFAIGKRILVLPTYD